MNALAVKFAVIAGLAITLAIPLGLIRNKVLERERSRDQVQADIAASTAEGQRVSGPVLAFECTEWSSGNEKQQIAPCPPLYVLPERLRISGTVDTEVRKRGIYAARIFRGEVQFSGELRVPAPTSQPGETERRYSNPVLVLSVTDPRGLKGLPIMDWRGERWAMEPGVGISRLGSGVHFPLGVSAEPGPAHFNLKIDLQGTNRLEIAPLGRETEVIIASRWPHPSFIGRYLPDEREVSDAGFTATWRTTHFATGAADKWREVLETPAKQSTNILGVAFISPINFYSMAYRAAEYGLLFIVLTFGVLLFTEQIKELRIHPIQYGLVGLALAVFYLLLIALAEHIGFTNAYAIAATACVVLLAYYARFVLGSWWSAARYTAWNSVLYATLYVIIAAEDYALLLGSVLLFGFLAVSMIITRKVDWYALADRLGAPKQNDPESTQVGESVSGS